MGRLTDLLTQKGLITDSDTPSASPTKKLNNLGEIWAEKDMTNQLKSVYQEKKKTAFNLHQVFNALPSLGEFYIPIEMNGRIVECSENAFQEKNEKRVIQAKVYLFDGYEVLFVYYDPSDQTIQKGRFTEFPRNAVGNKMGHIGMDQNHTLGWISKAMKGV